MEEQSSKLLLGTPMSLWVGKGPLPPVIRGVSICNFQLWVEVVLMKLDHPQWITPVSLLNCLKMKRLIREKSPWVGSIPFLGSHSKYKLALSCPYMWFTGHCQVKIPFLVMWMGGEMDGWIWTLLSESLCDPQHPFCKTAIECRTDIHAKGTEWCVLSNVRPGLAVWPPALTHWLWA